MKRFIRKTIKFFFFSLTILIPCIFLFDFTYADSSTAYPDTVYFEPAPGYPTSPDGDTLYTYPGDDVKINIHLKNVDTIYIFFIALIDSCYKDNIFFDPEKNNGTDDPICFEGGRVEYWYGKMIDLSQYSHFLIAGSNCEFAMPPILCAASLPTGDGPIITLTFTALDSGEICLDTLAYHYGPLDYTLLVIHSDAIGYVPVFIPRTFYVRFCPYNPGDLNCDKNTDMVDAAFLVNYLFRDGEEPYPLKCADVNCDQGVGLSDVVYLINYIFRSGPSPQICEY